MEKAYFNLGWCPYIDWIHFLFVGLFGSCEIKWKFGGWMLELRFLVIYMCEIEKHFLFVNLFDSWEN